MPVIERQSLRGGAVVVAENAGDLPGAVLIDPEVDEVGLALGCGAVGGVGGVEEAMGAALDGAEVLHGVGAEAGGDELAGDLAADVGLDGSGEGGDAEGAAALVVVELDVRGEEGGELVEEARLVAVVVGVEELGVEGADGLLELGLGVDLVEREGGGLGFRLSGE